MEIDPERHERRERREPQAAALAANHLLDGCDPDDEEEHRQQVRAGQPVRRGDHRGRDHGQEGDHRIRASPDQKAVEKDVGRGDEARRDRHEAGPSRHAMSQGPADVREPLVGEPLASHERAGEGVRPRHLAAFENKGPGGHVHGRIRVSEETLPADPHDGGNEKDAQQIGQGRLARRGKTHRGADTTTVRSSARKPRCGGLAGGPPTGV